jgi:hypothetical protein
MGCFEDYMDFREEVDRITKKGNANEDPKIKAPIIVFNITNLTYHTGI